MSAPLAPAPMRPPQLPVKLLFATCRAVERGPDGLYWMWHFYKGHPIDEAPAYFGESRAEVNRRLQDDPTDGPVYVVPE